MSSLSDAAKDEREQTDAQSDLDASSLEPADEQFSSNDPHRSTSPVLPLPDIPDSTLDLDLSLILSTPSSNAEVEKVQKRASNVLKLSQENEKLKAELKAMTDRLEAAERRREKLARKEQKIMEAPSS
ncbi:hypothetical protein FPV67DRAFT_25698 [Lyophyllum atratum]|nr:hypothetical protein FPV67DRAFT_25698 [Lyophyllum atratum]